MSERMRWLSRLWIIICMYSTLSGVIESVGDNVSDLKVGDPVFTVRTETGACAEFAVADSQHTFPLNTDRLTHEQGACLGVPYFTAYRALFLRYSIASVKCTSSTTNNK